MKVNVIKAIIDFAIIGTVIYILGSSELSWIRVTLMALISAIVIGFVDQIIESLKEGFDTENFQSIGHFNGHSKNGSAFASSAESIYNSSYVLPYGMKYGAEDTYKCQLKNGDLIMDPVTNVNEYRSPSRVPPNLGYLKIPLPGGNRQEVLPLINRIPESCPQLQNYFISDPIASTGDPLLRRVNRRCQKQVKFNPLVQTMTSNGNRSFRAL